MDLTLSTSARDGCVVVTLSGELDVYSAPLLRQQLIDLIATGNHRLVIDLQVEFIDSTGLGVLVGGLKRAKAHDGALGLVCTRSATLNVLRVTGLLQVFPVDVTVDAAVERIKP